MKTAILIVSAVTALTGCAGDTAIRAQVASANIELAAAQAKSISEPLVDVSMPCPPGYSCESGGMKITVRNPQSAPAYVAAPDDPWARVADRSIGVLGTLGGVWLGGQASAEIISAVGSVTAGAITASNPGASAEVANHAITTLGRSGTQANRTQAQVATHAVSTIGHTSTQALSTQAGVARAGMRGIADTSAANVSAGVGIQTAAGAQSQASELGLVLDAMTTTSGQGFSAAGQGIATVGAVGTAGMADLTALGTSALTIQADAVQGALQAMPDPIVVTQPAPIVVQQPEPIVVQD